MLFPPHFDQNFFHPSSAVIWTYVLNKAKLKNVFLFNFTNIFPLLQNAFRAFFLKKLNVHDCEQLADLTGTFLWYAALFNIYSIKLPRGPVGSWLQNTQLYLCRGVRLPRQWVSWIYAILVDCSADSLENVPDG